MWWAIMIGIVVIVIALLVVFMQSGNKFKDANQAGRALNRTSRKTKRDCRRTCDSLADASPTSRAQRNRIKNECMGRCQIETRSIFTESIFSKLLNA